MLIDLHAAVAGTMDRDGLLHRQSATEKVLNAHLMECALRHKEAVEADKAKRAEDIKFYKGILASVIGAALIGLLGLLVLGIRVWNTTPLPTP